MHGDYGPIVGYVLEGRFSEEQMSRLAPDSDQFEVYDLEKVIDLPLVPHTWRECRHSLLLKVSGEAGTSVLQAHCAILSGSTSQIVLLRKRSDPYDLTEEQAPA
jgi:hypothetical protein